MNRGAVVRAVLHPGVAMASAIAAFVFFLICGDPWRLGVCCAWSNAATA